MKRKAMGSNREEARAELADIHAAMKARRAKRWARKASKKGRAA